jgi:hypothetical protein
MMSIYASLHYRRCSIYAALTLVSHSDSNNKLEAHSPGVKWKTIRAFVLGHGVPYIVICEFVRWSDRPSQGIRIKAWIFEVKMEDRR